jgi:hypothetical protein
VLRISRVSGEFQMASYLHDDGEWKVHGDQYPKGIGADEIFSIRIEVHGHMLNISYMGAEKEISFGFIPPWAANWLTVIF